MIGRKLLLLQNGQILERSEFVLKAPVLEEWKHSTIRGARKHSYNALVATIRFYFRASSLIKNSYQGIKTKIKDLGRKETVENEKREISKFLKVISEYKHKIRRIKQKVKEEESL
ncbi:MAG: hypothetical protein WCT44_03310 [Candidatus Paceibacterota bacterium]